MSSFIFMFTLSTILYLTFFDRYALVDARFAFPQVLQKEMVLKRLLKILLKLKAQNVSKCEVCNNVIWHLLLCLSYSGYFICDISKVV